MDKTGPRAKSKTKGEVSTTFVKGGVIKRSRSGELLQVESAHGTSKSRVKSVAASALVSSKRSAALKRLADR